jgi:hypothetical protein
MLFAEFGVEFGELAVLSRFNGVDALLNGQAVGFPLQ